MHRPSDSSSTETYAGRVMGFPRHNVHANPMLATRRFSRAVFLRRDRHQERNLKKTHILRLRLCHKIILRLSQSRLRIVTYDVPVFLFDISKANLRTLSRTVLRFCTRTVQRQSLSSNQGGTWRASNPGRRRRGVRGAEGRDVEGVEGVGIRAGPILRNFSGCTISKVHA